MSNLEREYCYNNKFLLYEYQNIILILDKVNIFMCNTHVIL